MITEQHFHLPKPEPYQRLGSGDGEREASMTRPMPYEPLPASVLFCHVLRMVFIADSSKIVSEPDKGAICLRVMQKEKVFAV